MKSPNYLNAVKRSPLANELLEYAINLAQKHNRKLKLVHSPNQQEREQLEEGLEISVVRNKKEILLRLG